MTFDGNADILIQLSNAGAYTTHYYLFVFDEPSKQFVAIPSFVNITNPAADAESEQLLSHYTGDGSAFYAYYRYDADKRIFIHTNSLYFHGVDANTCFLQEFTFEDGDGKIIKDVLVKGTAYDPDRTDPHVQPYFESDSFWELGSDKWTRCYNR